MSCSRDIHKTLRIFLCCNDYTRTVFLNFQIYFERNVIIIYGQKQYLQTEGKLGGWAMGAAVSIPSPNFFVWNLFALQNWPERCVFDWFITVTMCLTGSTLNKIHLWRIFQSLLTLYLQTVTAETLNNSPAASSNVLYKYLA